MAQSWQVVWVESARKELRKLDAAAQKEILAYLRERIVTEYDPKRFGKALSGDMLGLWRYRVGNHRIICRIEQEKVIVLVLAVGHRKNVYE